MARNRARVVLELIGKNLVGPAVAAAKRDLGALVKSATSLKGAIGSAAASIGVSLGLSKAFSESDELNKAFNKLTGTSKLTGLALADLDKAAARFATSFSLSSAMASDFTAEVGRLVNKAGDVSQLDATMSSFLNLAAARGYDAEEALVAVRQAILGIDEGTDKLFGVNPSVLYEEYAKSVGKTAGALTDAEKAQAIVNAALRDGAKVGDSYKAFLETGRGAQAQFTKEANEGWAALGAALDPLRAKFFQLLAGLADGFTSFIQLVEFTSVYVVSFLSDMVDRFKIAGANIGAAAVDFASAFVGIFNKEVAKGMRDGAASWKDGIVAGAKSSLAGSAEALELLRRQQLGIRDVGAGGGKRTPPPGPTPDELAKARKKELDDLFERAKIAEQALGLETLRAQGMKAAAEAEAAIVRQLKSGKATLEEQVALTERLGSLRKARGEAVSAALKPDRDRLDAASTRLGDKITKDVLNRTRAPGAVDPITLLGGNPDDTPGFGGRVLQDLDAAISRTREGLGGLQGTLSDIALDGVSGFRDAWIEGFAAIAEGSGTLGDALEAGVLSFLGTAARKVGDFFMAQSIASFASTFGPIPNPGGPKAGAGYLAGALGMYALAGVSAGAGRNVSGGGGGGGGFSRTDGFRDNLALPGARSGEAVIYLEGGPMIDTTNYRHREALRSALEEVGGRRVVVRTG